MGYRQMLAAVKQHGLKGKTLTLALLGLSVLALGACSGSDSGSGSLPSYTVSTSAGAGGSISPESTTVTYGNVTSLTVTPDGLYRIVEVSGCGGTLSGNTYTTGEITVDCSVTASYAIHSPQELRATGVADQVALAWEAIDDAADYCVYVSKNPGITLDTAASYDSSLSICTGLTNPSHTIAGLANGDTYYFAVTAKKGSEETPISNEVNATVGAQANDTGVTKCGNNVFYPEPSVTLDCAAVGATKTEAGIDSNGIVVPQGQDALYGRDADTQLVKVGGGAAGFDFTRICNNGEAEGEGGCPVDMTADDIGDGANQWACTRDNVTGLMWEIKSLDSTHLRYYQHTYSILTKVDEGVVTATYGTENRGTCHDDINCDTDKFVIQVNANGGLCGYADWRMPIKKELRSILNLARHTPASDIDYFPDTNLDTTDLYGNGYFPSDITYNGAGSTNIALGYYVSFNTAVDSHAYAEDGIVNAGEPPVTARVARARLVRSTGVSVYRAAPPAE